MDIKKDILWRVYLIFLTLLVFGCIVLGKAIYIQQVQGKYWRSMSDSLHVRYEALHAERGTIYSEDGNMLSTSIPEFDVYIDFAADGLREKNGKRFTENLDSLSINLANLFKDKKTDDYKKELQNAYNNEDRYYVLNRKINFQQYITLSKFPLVRMGRNKSGFIISMHTKRLNPFKLLANRTIGLSRENAQNVGLEQTYDSLLKGSTGKRLVRYMAGGSLVPVEGSEIDPEDGKDIVTTIDVNIQDIAENALMRMMQDNQAEHGTCIVMEVKTGKIKAIANLGRISDGNYWENYNYAITASEPGSTFKLATLLAVLEDKHAQLNSSVNLEGGVWHVAGRTVYDSEKHGRYDVTVQQAFELSSNVGMAKLAWMYYNDHPSKFIDHLKHLHLNQLSGLGLRGETHPIIFTPESKYWSKTTLPWMAFGYNVMVSPLQTLMLYNAVANNGKMMKPYLVNTIMQDGKIVHQFNPEIIEEKICSSETLQQLKTCLEGVVLHGTAKNLKDSNYVIAGKTGTALVANGKRGYADHIYQSSFAGYFPADNPQYSCIVVIKNKSHAAKFYGALVAGPVFKAIADRLYATQVNSPASNIATAIKDSSNNYNYVSIASNLKKILQQMHIVYRDSAKASNIAQLSYTGQQYAIKKIHNNTNTMPSLQGMGFKDALYVLENMGVKIMARGRGKVSAQSITAGTVVRKNEVVYVQLN